MSTQPNPNPITKLPGIITSAPAGAKAPRSTPSPTTIVRLPTQNDMPADGQSFDLTPQSVATPAVGASVVVVEFTVPKGYDGYIKRISNICTSGAFADFSGSLIWQILLSFQGFDAAGNALGQVAPFYNNITASLGAAANPSIIDGIKVTEGNTFALICKNIGLAAGPSLLGGRLGGYFYSTGLDPRSQTF
jgi:hypothetical protein